MLSQKSSLKSQSNKPLGEILLEAGLISIYQMEIALQEQEQYHLKIDEILVTHGWIKQKTADFLSKKWSTVIQKPPKRPIAFYLHAAGLLDQKQLFLLKEKQRQKENKLENRLHDLAVEEGYIKQKTVNFFLKSLFRISKSQSLYFTKPYEIIKNYINGESNFSGLECSQAPLSGIKLVKVILDDSNFRQADLSRCNFSYSSLIKTNLILANLRLANLTNVNFSQACLIEADLRNSNLEQANFKEANLQGVDLRGSNLRCASFEAADLRGACLASSYSYDVYYSKQTTFDKNFEPKLVGWKLKD